MRFLQPLSYLASSPFISFKSRPFSSKCNYTPPMFFRFGYVGAIIIGGVYALTLRRDNIFVHDEIQRMKKDMKDISTKQQNDTARIISLLESHKK
jgi:hypothetical protein